MLNFPGRIWLMNMRWNKCEPKEESNPRPPLKVAFFLGKGHTLFETPQKGAIFCSWKSWNCPKAVGRKIVSPYMFKGFAWEMGGIFWGINKKGRKTQSGGEFTEAFKRQLPTGVVFLGVISRHLRKVSLGPGKTSGIQSPNFLSPRKMCVGGEKTREFFWKGQRMSSKGWFSWLRGFWGFWKAIGPEDKKEGWTIEREEGLFSGRQKVVPRNKIPKLGNPFSHGREKCAFFEHLGGDKMRLMANEVNIAG